MVVVMIENARLTMANVKNPSTKNAIHTIYCRRKNGLSNTSNIYAK